MAQASATLKDEFENTTEGHIGVITLDPTGKERGIAVRPKATIWLTEAEQILTANAPRRDEDNPFANGQLRLKTKAADVKNRRPIGNQQEVSNGSQPEAPKKPNESNPSSEEAPRKEPKPKPATARQREDRERAKAEAKRKADADAQAQAGAIPGQETGSQVSSDGTPKIEGKSASNEEVADPAAPARKAAVK